ncbi:MAG: hypothetical protein H0T80_09025 [Betaproteobacteria bacterium]|nr:hypothetical protein [Betaproteobacteria bacterium]
MNPNTGTMNPGGMTGSSANPSMGGTADRAQQTADRAHQTVDRVAERAVPAVDRLSQAVHQTIDKVADKATPAVEWAEQKTTEIRDRSSQFAETCSAYVREQPLVSVGAALAVGYLIGRLSR